MTIAGHPVEDLDIRTWYGIPWAGGPGQEGMRMRYVAIAAEAGDGYSAYLPDLPGCIAAGDTFEEASCLMREAV